jgi:20S proteasome alpha/beta subunit
MTLIAAFRCRNNGILLCADRQEDDGVAKRQVDKIHRLSGLKECEVWVAGSGMSTTVDDAYIEADRSLRDAEKAGISLLSEHKEVIENSLKGTHDRYKEYVRGWPLHMIFVVAPRLAGRAPILYRTDKHRLIPVTAYTAWGSGKTIADYLADRLYQHGIQTVSLVVLAAFIFREAEAASGVGLGNDMVLTHPGGWSEYHTESIAEIQKGIPALEDTIRSHWPENVKVPEWLNNSRSD